MNRTHTNALDVESPSRYATSAFDASQLLAVAEGSRFSLLEDRESPYAVEDEFEHVPGCPTPLQTRSMKTVAISLLALGVAFGACAQSPEPVADQGSDFLEGVVIDPPTETSPAAPAASSDTAPAASLPGQGTDATADLDDLEIDIDSNVDHDGNAIPDAPAPRADGERTADGPVALGQEPDGPAPATEDGVLSAWLDPLRVSLKHETSYKFASPKRVVNNRSSVRVEYSKPLTSNLYLRLDTKLNLHQSNDHRAKAKDEDLFRELVTREAYLQNSFGNTSFRIGYQILPWGVSEGGAITDEVSPRNSAEFFFIPLEESRVGQPMLVTDHFGDAGQWTAFFVPKPGYNKYPDRGSEYDIPGAFDKNAPDDDWDNAGTYEFGARWKRSFGKNDISLMAARLIDNDYLVRQQRFRMYGLTANVAIDNLLLRAEVALKQPRAYFARPAGASDVSIVESDQFDSSFGFDYSPGGRALTYSAEVVLSRLLDWRNDIVGRERDEYSLVGSVRNRFFNDDLTLSWLTIYSKPYTRFQHRFLSSYLIDDHSTVYFELFFPQERDERSGTWPYRDQKQFVIRYQYQF
ncbi:hypothetical protein [Tahibacter amnicola]|uniref:Beta-barrel porin 2 n=1 Tax=Tahibacter amnicola TaxID=2976241 RepID=A0ABY6BA25_9GAMM|nr:hypothetical protein [Tahibacter amnicola]UXI66005.1 hypothetical protein N4264_14720 [Tahibacter amnicola]